MLSYALKRILGVACLVFGFVALFVPVIPGAILLFIGMELLGLSFLLPKPIRSRWDRLKLELTLRWKRWRKPSHA